MPSEQKSSIMIKSLCLQNKTKHHDAACKMFQARHVETTALSREYSPNDQQIKIGQDCHFRGLQETACSISVVWATGQE